MGQKTDIKRMNPFLLALKNKHTTSAGAVYFSAKILGEIGVVWFPDHKPQIHSTLQIVEAAAVGWGLLMAGDANQGLSKQEAETGFLKKEDVIPEAKT
jgi:hypothetical protein